MAFRPKESTVTKIRDDMAAHVASNSVTPAEARKLLGQLHLGQDWQEAASAPDPARVPRKGAEAAR